SALTPPRESALTPRSDSPSLPVEPGLVDVPFGHPEAFGHLPGRVFGPHTGIDQGADFAEVVLRGGLDLGGAREHQRLLPAQSCGGRLPQRADGPAQSLLVGLREFAADAHRAGGADDLGEVAHRVGDAVRTLEEDHRPLLGLEFLEQGPALTRLARKEPFETNRSLGRPETARAMSTADGPGVDVIAR